MMRTATRRGVGGWWAAFAAVGAACWLVGHGCHGPDEDHEPTVVPPMFRDADRNRSSP